MFSAKLLGHILGCRSIIVNTFYPNIQPMNIL